MREFAGVPSRKDHEAIRAKVHERGMKIMAKQACKKKSLVDCLAQQRAAEATLKPLRGGFRSFSQLETKQLRAEESVDREFEGDYQRRALLARGVNPAVFHYAR